MNRQRGSLLVMTLWIVTILGALSVAVARYLSTEVRLTKYRLARQEARELARSGALLALNVIWLDRTPDVDWLGDEWVVLAPIELGQGRRLTITITDEDRKLNVNAASAEQLEPLLGSRQLAEAIVDYADLNTDGPAESPVDTPPYYPKNAPIVALEELRDLPNMTDEIFAALQQFTFAAPGAPLTLTVNINTATQPAMLAYGLSGDTVNRIDEILRTPNGRFEQPGTILSTLGWDITDPAKAGEGTLLSSMMTSSSVFLVVAEGVVEQPAVRVRIQAVIQRSADPTSPAPKIIAWRES